MTFFDLNIPYDTVQSTKQTRTKLVIKAMELGYTAVAYNHTIKGIMSDHNRCSIPLLSLSSLLSLAPSLASSVTFHRDLLRIPPHEPFRQYTRLTVCVESAGQSQVLNSGNPVLKSYDLVAVRPGNQSTFDHACEKAEVDIIAIDFSEKLPFRLKLPMVRAAMERGVHFEISYSDLIMDVQVRRQMISNAKLLVDWTRGKNIIFSSAAPSVNELRGPYDVANLSSLLGLSMERAKAAISKNCRTLITNALRKKNFYKEAIRVELISSDEKGNSNNLVSADWFKWDPISSGGGDLQLDDIAKSFSATNVSKTVKAIDFVSIIDSVPSHGGNLFAGIRESEVPITTIGMTEKPGKNDLLETNRNLLGNTPSIKQTYGHKNSQEKIRMHTNNHEQELKNLNGSDISFPPIEIEGHDLQPHNCVHSCESSIILPSENVIGLTSNMDFELNLASADEANLHILPENVNLVAHHVEKSSQDSDVVFGVQEVMMDEDVGKMATKDQENIPMTKNVLGKENLAESDYYTLPHQVEESTNSLGSDTALDVQNVMMDEDTEKMDTKDQEKISLAKTVSGKQQLEESRYSKLTLVECSPFVPTSDDMNVKDVSSLANHQILHEMLIEKQELVNDAVEAENILVADDGLHVKHNSSVAICEPVEELRMIIEQKHEEACPESGHPIMGSSRSGKSRATKRAHHWPHLFPLRRLSYPMPFKKKAKQFKGRLKMR